MTVVAEASSAEEALAIAPRIAPDILLLDIALPGMSGVELVRELAPRLPATKIVMLTVSSADRDVADAMRYGASGYLTKDLAPEALPEPFGRRRPASWSSRGGSRRGSWRGCRGGRWQKRSSTTHRWTA